NYYSDSTSKVQGYYGPGSYDNYLKFANVTQGINGTFKITTEDSRRITIDGYYNVSLFRGGKTTTGTYYAFGNGTSLLLNIDGKETIVWLNTEDKTYDIAYESDNKTPTTEAGKWATTASASNYWYLDGKGNLLYFTSGAYDEGTYTYDTATKVFEVVYDGVAAENGEVGSLDIENGVGSIAYMVGTSISYAGLSRTEIQSVNGLYGVTAFVAGINEKGEVVTNNPYFSIKIAGNNLFFSMYGTAVVTLTLDAPLADGTVCTFNHTCEYNGVTFTANYQVVFAESDGKFTASIVPVEYYLSEGTVMAGEVEYTVSWIDPTHVVVWKMESWGGNVYASGTLTVDTITKNYTVSGEQGDFVIRNYGKDNATIEKVE
ncbi:MAG: hypothetical protein K2M36_05250, partial [Clostridia bacterium]|nr:hypothetical protein [Clostridia bacterium]